MRTLAFTLIDEIVLAISWMTLRTATFAVKEEMELATACVAVKEPV